MFPADSVPEFVVTTCRASAVLRNETAVDAVELFDRASLRECEADEKMTKLVGGGSGGAAGWGCFF
jgi:D-lactate dehydrogenase